MCVSVCISGWIRHEGEECYTTIDGISGWKEIEMLRYMRERLNRPVFIEKDTAACLHSVALCKKRSLAECSGLIRQFLRKKAPAEKEK